HVAPPDDVVSWRGLMPSSGNSTRLNGCSSGATAATIARPSGRHAGVTLRPSVFGAMTRTALLSTAPMTISSDAPGRCSASAIEGRSGDHRGALNCVSGSDSSMLIVTAVRLKPDTTGAGDGAGTLYVVSGFSRTTTRSRCPGCT